jgi:hypothetical protein
MRFATATQSTAGPGVSHPRTPVEYLKNNEDAMFHPAPRTGQSASGTRQGFIVHAHRLSSLWRVVSVTHTWLKAGKHASASLFGKYSAGVWGCKTPTATFTKGATP